MRVAYPFKAQPIHYGWVILAAGGFGSFMTVPGQTAGVSVFFDPITVDLGISRSWASVAYAAGTLAGILPAPIIGRWIDGRGPRLTGAIMAGGLAAACAFMAAIQSGLMLLVGFALLRGTAIGGLSLVSQQVVNLWFVQRRGIAAAAASLGLAAGSMLFPQAIERLISLYGWRGAYLALALLVVATILPVAALLFRDRPEKFGLSIDAGLQPVAGKIREDEPSFTREQALRTRAFWLLCAASFLTNAIGTALLLNHFSILARVRSHPCRRPPDLIGARWHSGGRHSQHRSLVGPLRTAAPHTRRHDFAGGGVSLASLGQRPCG
jgi:MFS family permease